MVQLLHPYRTTGKTVALTRWTFVSKVMSLLLNMLSKLIVIKTPIGYLYVKIWELESLYILIYLLGKLFDCYYCLLTSLVVQKVKRLPKMQETRVWSLVWEDPLEKKMATHSSILAWKIPWTEEPGWLLSMGSQRVGHNWSDLACMHACIGEENGNPLQYSCLENPRDGGAW